MADAAPLHGCGGHGRDAQPATHQRNPATSTQGRLSRGHLKHITIFHHVDGRDLAQAGYAVEGVEFDPGLAELGGAHLRSAGLRETIKVGDFLDDALIAPEPAYDVITCNDVIEHVSDPARCLRKIFDLLKPGGVAWIETVNKRSMRNVHSDIHFQTFGIHLLDHHSASAAYRQYTGSPDYQVSDFFEPEWYLNVARSAPQAEARLIGAAQHDFDVGLELQHLFSRYHSWRQNERHSLDPFLQHEIERALFTYVLRMMGALEVAHAQGSHDEFFDNWVDPIIRILMRKRVERSKGAEAVRT